MTFVLNFQMPILDPKPAVRCPHALTHTLVRVYTYVYVHTCSHMYAYVSTPTERERESESFSCGASASKIPLRFCISGHYYTVRLTSVCLFVCVSVCEHEP